LDDGKEKNPYHTTIADYWPPCAIPQCKNLACLAVQSPFCFSHTTDYLVKKIADRRITTEVAQKVLREVMNLQDGLL